LLSAVLEWLPDGRVCLQAARDLSRICLRFDFAALIERSSNFERIKKRKAPDLTERDQALGFPLEKGAKAGLSLPVEKFVYARYDIDEPVWLSFSYSHTSER
jgi:hypothetical protein